MIEKYILKLSAKKVKGRIRTNRTELGIRFVHCQERIEIGGNAKLSVEMSAYLNDFFNVEEVSWRWSGMNKIRMEAKCSVEQFSSGMKQMALHGVHYTKVNSLGRIMR